MKRFDYHLHSEHSMDGEMTVDEVCRAAIRAGLDEICLTEHTEFGHPADWADRPPDVPRWLSDIEAARAAYPALTIRAGIEIGDNPLCRDRIKAWHGALPLDFLLLSLHLVDQQDPYYPEFFEGRTQQDAYRRYVECKLESLLAWEPGEYDAMAHLGYCAKFAPYEGEQRRLRYHHAPDALDALFTRLAQSGKAIEINTSGYPVMREFLPDRELLTRFRELGGEFVTLGSDAHRPERVGDMLDDARELARACGLKYALTFEGRKAIAHAL